MAAVVEVDAGQAAKRSKETEEEGKPPHPVGAVRKQRQPTPDHPPYCWVMAYCPRGFFDRDLTPKLLPAPLLFIG